MYRLEMLNFPANIAGKGRNKIGLFLKLQPNSHVLGRLRALTKRNYLTGNPLDILCCKSMKSSRKNPSIICFRLPNLLKLDRPRKLLAAVELHRSRLMSTDRRTYSPSTAHRGKHNDERSESDGFLGLGVAPRLVKKLSEVSGIIKPLKIQSLAIPHMYRSKNVIMQSETGSGKTLAYLLPTIQQAKFPCSAVIVVPTRELAYQIYIEARKLTDNKDVACYVSRPGIELEFEKLKTQPPKIVIGTPKQLLSVVQDHEFLFTNVRRVITDEVDKMYPPIPWTYRHRIHKRQKYPKPFEKLLAVFQGIAKGRLQLIASSATINQLMVDNLKDNGWGFSPRIIRPEAFESKEKIVPESIKHNYVLVEDNSIDSKAAVVSKIFTRTNQRSALVFIHRDHSVNDYVDEMRNLNLNAVAFYKEVLSGNTGDVIRFLDDFRTGKISVVVASEEQVRGLDFKELSHVYLFEVPRSLEEYLHLAGRVGRVGREGTVTTIISELHETRFKRLQRMYEDLGITPKKIII